MTEEARRDAIEKAEAYFSEAGIVLTEQEKQEIEVADFGLDDFDHTGLTLYTYVNNDRYCAKELILFPRQTCPEHKHVDTGQSQGKQETFRCRRGVVYLYVEGEATLKPASAPPAESPPGVYTAFHEIILMPGEQYTIAPNTKHWFQAGPEGAVVSEFSSPSSDETDVFTDPNIRRMAR